MTYQAALEQWNQIPRRPIVCNGIEFFPFVVPREGDDLENYLRVWHPHITPEEAAAHCSGGRYMILGMTNQPDEVILFQVWQNLLDRAAGD